MEDNPYTKIVDEYTKPLESFKHKTHYQQESILASLQEQLCKKVIERHDYYSVEKLQHLKDEKVNNLMAVTTDNEFLETYGVNSLKIIDINPDLLNEDGAYIIEKDGVFYIASLEVNLVPIAGIIKAEFDDETYSFNTLEKYNINGC